MIALSHSFSRNYNRFPLTDALPLYTPVTAGFTSRGIKYSKLDFIHFKKRSIKYLSNIPNMSAVFLSSRPVPPMFENSATPVFAASHSCSHPKTSPPAFIPDRLPHFWFSLLREFFGSRHDKRKHSHQTRRRSWHCLVRPLPVRFNPEMSTRFFKRHFRLPSFNEPFDDPARRCLAICAMQGLRFKLPARVARQPQRSGTNSFPT